MGETRPANSKYKLRIRRESRIQWGVAIRRIAICDGGTAPDGAKSSGVPRMPERVGESVGRATGIARPVNIHGPPEGRLTYATEQHKPLRRRRGPSMEILLQNSKALLRQCFRRVNNPRREIRIRAHVCTSGVKSLNARIHGIPPETAF